jgi:hypothetical protein
VIAIPGSTKLPPYRVLPEPPLAFGDGRPQARHLHPLLGLLEHGPYSKNAFAILKPKLRVATITPEDAQAHVFQFLKSLQNEHKPRERKDYLPAFAGFEAIFGVPIHGARREAHVTLPSDTITANQGDMHSLGEALRRGLDRLQSMRDEFDVVAIYLPDRWQPGFEDLERGLDLHHEIKSFAAVAGLSTQFLQESRALSYFDRCSVAWRLGIAFYAKAGGTPWRLVPNAADTAYIGLSYAIRGGTTDKFVTCCSQVFDADGGGMEFVAYDVGDGVDFENPFLSRADMRAVMSRSLAVYQGRNAGRLPRRVVIHKTQAFREEEIDGCIDAWGRTDEIECVQVVTSNDWRAVRLLGARTKDALSTPDSWPVERGTLVPFSDRSVLLFINGDAPSVAVRGHYVQGGKGIPRPITLVRHAGAGPLERLGEDALALSKMDWNNDALFDSLPVTIEYSKRLSQTIAHATSLPSGTYPYRLFM